MAAAPSALLGWLREHEPDALARSRWILSSTDWLRLRLTGTTATDPTMAAAAFVSLESPGWSPEALALCGHDDLIAKLTRCAPGPHLCRAPVFSMPGRGAGDDRGLPESECSPQEL
jgi:L-xylulokinase